MSSDESGIDDDDVSIDDIELEARAAMRAGDIEAEIDLRSTAAQFHIEEGEPGRAVEHCERLIAIHSDVQGPRSDKAMVWRGFLGRAYTEARLYDRAEEVLRELLLDRTMVLGPDHPSTLVTRGNLARAIGRGGRPKEALELAEQLLADRVRILGPDHPSTLDSRGHVAQLHDLAGDPVTALRMLRELLADRTSKRHAIVLAEILGPPRGLSPFGAM